MPFLWKPIEPGTLTFARLQDEHRLWADHSFPNREPYYALLGMIKELGELEEAFYKGADGEEEDALIDSVIFLIDYCNQLNLSVAECVTPEIIMAGHKVHSPIIHLGKIAHAHLKSIQGIRSQEDHEQTRKLHIGLFLRAIAERFECSGESFQAHLEAVWSKVRERDWKADKNTAHLKAETTWRQCAGADKDRGYLIIHNETNHDVGVWFGDEPPRQNSATVSIWANSSTEYFSLVPASEIWLSSEQPIQAIHQASGEGLVLTLKPVLS